MFETLSARLRARLNFDVAACFGDTEKNLQIRCGQQSVSFFGPFHQTDRIRVEIFAETCVLPFDRIVETIEIKVIEV